MVLVVVDEETQGVCVCVCGGGSFRSFREFTVVQYRNLLVLYAACRALCVTKDLPGVDSRVTAWCLDACRGALCTKLIVLA